MGMDPILPDIAERLKAGFIAEYRVVVQGEVAGFGGQSVEGGGRRFSNLEWKTVLGNYIFDLGNNVVAEKWSPTFRSLIAYFARRGDGFSTPFQHYRVSTSGTNRSTMLSCLALPGRTPGPGRN